MGYREDVVIIYSKKGFDELINRIGSTLLTDEQREQALTFLNEADLHQTAGSGEDHLFFFDSINTLIPSIQVVLNKLHKVMDQDQFFVQYLGEDGGEEQDGGYFENPFSPFVTHSLSWGCGDEVADKLSVEALCLPTDVPAPVATPVVAVDNYTCPCGNKKLSTREKLCWSCGELIVTS